MAREKYILGISAFYHDSAAALVSSSAKSGSRVMAAAQEERFSRLKGDANFPQRAINYCLGQLPEHAELDGIAYYENPPLKMERMIKTASRNAPRGARAWPQLLSRLKQLNTELPEKLLGVLDDPERIHFCAHHRSHAASAFYPSSFKQAAVLVADGVGEWSTTSIWAGTEKELKPVTELRFPNSIGLFYSAFTQYCGFKVNSGEYKLMGLAPFGKPRFRKRIRDHLIDIKADGSFSLNMKYFGFHVGPSTISPLFESLFGKPARTSREPIHQHHMDMAASVQAVLNIIMRRLSQQALELTGLKNLCLAGGVALNCVSNRAIFRHLPENTGLWIQPAAGDAGGAIGAALSLAEKSAPKPKNASRPYSTFLGPSFDAREIKAAIKKRGLKFEQFDTEAAIVAKTADALKDGAIIGHFDGPMEFGPRALGNRSILADPRPEGMLSRINRKIKFREGWRPFAPAILADEAAKYFNPPTVSPYMLLVSDLKKKYRMGETQQQVRAKKFTTPQTIQAAVTTEFSAISHVDHSSRLQTVSKESGTRLFEILQAFFAATGCPILLNTSFNVRGEPIVCAPVDAVECFLNTHMDVLVMGRFMVYRADLDPSLKEKIGKKVFRAD